MPTQLFHSDPQTLSETLENAVLAFDRRHQCFGADCFMTYCDHPRRPENRQDDLKYLWEVFLYSREAAAAA